MTKLMNAIVSALEPSISSASVTGLSILMFVLDKCLQLLLLPLLRWSKRTRKLTPNTMSRSSGKSLRLMLNPETTTIS